MRRNARDVAVFKWQKGLESLTSTIDALEGSLEDMFK